LSNFSLLFLASIPASKPLTQLLISKMNKVKYHLSNDDNFVIDNYNQAPTFASFLPGIAGQFGCPMWVFYCNRGQAISSCGILDKDNAIMEFLPANKAMRQTQCLGFRTFIKIKGKVFEPFRNSGTMLVSSDSLKLIDENKALKVRVEVTYFTVANEAFPALARIVTVTNLGPDQTMEIVDGLPVIIPAGFNDDLLKRISQTISAWCLVENLDNNAPLFRLKVNPADCCETTCIEKANFYLPVSSVAGQLKAIIDSHVVFGPDTSFDQPVNLLSNNKFTVPKRQLAEGIIPSALAYQKIKLKKKQTLTLSSLFGQVDDIKRIHDIKAQAEKPGYFESKFKENQELVTNITDNLATKSSQPTFDLYARQTFLDNVMRGGLPVELGNKLLYIYYRKHGDMERDYNNFKVMPTYFSQGNGNYRDINQNRRCDIFFNPLSGEDNIIRFFNLIQLDGYNPLVVLSSKFQIESALSAKKLLEQHLNKSAEPLIKQLISSFILGDILKHVESFGLGFKTSKEEFAKALLAEAKVEEGAQHGEGFWIDHGFYNTDLLESFSAVYPDKISDLLFNDRSFTFFDNDHIVHPRSHKYSLHNGAVRQFVAVQADAGKQAQIVYRTKQKNLVRTNYGQGEVYYTTLAAKILCLIAGKAASFDPQGIGLEMEAEKPDWYDALNGLPGLLGSSLSETLELKRLCQFMLNHWPTQNNLKLPIEVLEFIKRVNGLLVESNNDFDYWDTATTAKEAYREKTKLGLSGKEIELPASETQAFLQNIAKKCTAAIKKCLKKYGNYYTYFINEATDYETINNNNHHQEIKIKAFKQTPLPLFLEGFVHALKVEKDLSIPKLVKDSPLYDKKLKMFKVNAPLTEAPLEIGRCRAFTPGWLENESVFMHMEFKYLLELLKAGLYDEFFSALKTCLPAFLDPKVYKRSILENSSFLVSSANPNPNNHGRGFVARLSGACAEFIDMWVIMTTGKKMFSLDKDGKLNFKLSPVLPAWLFDQKGEFSFKLLGSIDVTYINKQKKDTFGKGVEPVSYKLTLEDDKEVEIKKANISEPSASLIRDRKIKQIIVILS